VLVGVVDVEHVDPVEPEPLQALLDTAENAVVGEVEDGIDRRRGWPSLEAAGELAPIRRHVRPQQSPELRREHDLVPRNAQERDPDAALCQAVAVERGRVEQAQGAIMGASQGRHGLLLVDRGVEAAERCGAETDPGHVQARRAELNPLLGCHADQMLPVGKRCAAMLSGSISALYPGSVGGTQQPSRTTAGLRKCSSRWSTYSMTRSVRSAETAM
jgi:hypothetical protein